MNKFYFSLFISLLLLPGCSSHKDSGQIITVTIEPQRYFAERLADSLFQVVTMVPAGTSPETYDPSPVQMANLARSKAYFLIGKIGFEEVWLGKMKENNPDLRFYDNSEGIEFITGEHHHHDHEGDHDHHSHAGHPGGVDPHTWSSPKEALSIVRNMCKALIGIDPANEDFYNKNREKLEMEIRETDETVRSLLNDSGQKAFIIYHPALTYFARDYGLEQYCIETDGKEPSPEQLKELVETVRSHEVKTIFIQQEFDKKNAELIAKETGCKLVVINPLSYDWSRETIAIAKALSGE